MTFTHLRVASGYSFQYGASHPGELVARAAELGMSCLGLTDRDGLYGAVRFAKACLKAGVDPVIGVDLAVVPAGWQPERQPTAARGGELRDPRLPRVVAWATSRSGWGHLCELISAAHAERGQARATLEMIAQHCAGRDIVVALGADSPIGACLAEQQFDAASRVVEQWRDELGGGLVLAMTNHHVAGRGIASAHHAAGMLRLGERLRIPTVVTNMARMARRDQAATCDVLDAARRLVPLDLRNIDRRNAEGYLKSEAQMRFAVEEASRLVGADPVKVLRETESLAERCALDPMADVGLGEIRLPEFEVLGTTQEEAPKVLRERCVAGLNARYGQIDEATGDRLEDELSMIGKLGFESYFLTVGEVTSMVRGMGIRCAARGSGAGSLVNYALGISGVDPMRYGLIMERFLSPLRVALPDIDLDVESARRTEVYDKIFETFGASRVACVAMLETYRVRHAVRDVGAALSLAPVEIDAMAKAFPHIRARDARAALRDLPELRAAGLAEGRLNVLFELVESLDGLPRHIALHPCGIILSDSALSHRTPTEASFGGYPMSQFDKDDVEDLGLLKLDVLGIRMQSAMAHAVFELERTTGSAPDIDALAPFDDDDVYDMIAHRETLGCFQIESPGQRELVGKFGPSSFEDIIIDISLFRPGPVKSDMITPFLDTRLGFREADRLHEDFWPFLEQTCGVVVFHEQIIELVAAVTGCTLAQGDEVRRALGDVDGQAQVKEWLFPKARERGYEEELIEKVWSILVGFASFGFCKAHAAAFALPTYQSAWLKRHHPAHFLAGVLTHDPGMYPKRLILEEVRRVGLAILGLDINASTGEYRAEQVGDGWGVRLSLADVKGISEDEIERIVDAAPYQSLTDFWQRAVVSEPVAEHLILAGAFDALYDIGDGEAIQSHEQVTRRDLLLALKDLHRGVKKQSPAQAAFTFFDEETLPTSDVTPTGLPEMGPEQRLKAELEILGLDASQHIMERYLPMLEAIGAVSSSTLLGQKNRAEILVAGVKAATQTPPVRSGRRVIFLTLDDSTGPVDATFFEDVQGPYSSTVFHSWMLLVRGVIRRTGPRGVSLRATGAWDLGEVYELWRGTLDRTHSPDAAAAAVRDLLREVPEGYSLVGEYVPPEKETHANVPQDHTRAGGMGRRRVLVHASGFKQSPYADIKPSGTSAAEAPRKLWHSSGGSAGR